MALLIRVISSSRITPKHSTKGQKNLVSRILESGLAFCPRISLGISPL